MTDETNGKGCLYSTFNGNSPDDYTRWYHILSLPFRRHKSQALLREVLSGLTVALAQVPEAVAFAFTAGVEPIVGLHAAWIICLITGIFGGAPGMISGATGAIAVVLPEFIEENGLGFLFIAILLMGVIQIIFGLIGAGRLVRLIGAPTMIGFVNGLAIVIFLAQFHTFKKSSCDDKHNNTEDGHTVYGPFEGCWLDGVTIAWELLLIAVTMAVIYLLPKITMAFPASLAGILVAMALEFALIRPLDYKTPLVEDLASVKGQFPIPIWFDDQYSEPKNSLNAIPSLLEWETYRICLPTSFTLSIIGLVESLLTLQLVSDITKREGSPRNECLAQGVANLVTGVFGGMGGCAMIGQSFINVKSGGVTRISSVTAGLVLLLILLAAYTIINRIPIAALTGVMFMVVVGTFDWSSLVLIWHALFPHRIRNHGKLNWHSKVKRTDAIIIVAVTIVAVMDNLATAVGVGVSFGALFFAWEQSQEKNFSVSVIMTDEIKHHRLYQLVGPLFFATSQRFEGFFNARDAAEANVSLVILDVTFGTLSDFSAIASLNNVASTFKKEGIKFCLRGVDEYSLNMIRKARSIMFYHDKDKTHDENEFELQKMEIKLGSEYTAVQVRKHYNGEFLTDGKIEVEQNCNHTDNSSSTDSSQEETTVSKA